MIEQTSDYRILNRILPWKPRISSEYIYLVDDKVNVWTLHKYKDGLMIHADMSKDCRGRKAVKSIHEAFEWAWKNMGVEMIYASIDEKKKHVCRFAAFAGMQFTHVENNRRFFEVKKWAC